MCEAVNLSLFFLHSHIYLSCCLMTPSPRVAGLASITEYPGINDSTVSAASMVA